MWLLYMPVKQEQIVCHCVYLCCIIYCIGHPAGTL